MAPDNPEDATYRGKRLTDMTREELIAELMLLARAHKECLEAHINVPRRSAPPAATLRKA